MPDILIRTEMPKTCALCPFSTLGMDCALKKQSVHLEWLECRRPDWCPLHELPEHGDLIDRSELKTNMIDDTFGYAARYVNLVQILDAPVIVPSNKEETP